MSAKSENPFEREPGHPHRKRRAMTHDYRREAKYLVTITKNPAIPKFSKVIVKSRVADGEDAPSVEILPGCEYVEEALSIWEYKFRQIFVAEYVIMPDHIHLCLDVRSYLSEGLSRAMAQLMGKISKCRHGYLYGDEQSEPIQPVFEKGFNDSIARTSQQWESQKAYVRDNPRRYLLKKENSDYLLARWLITIGDHCYTAKGNIFLLKRPHLFPVKHHRRWSMSESDSYQKNCRLMIDNESTPVSPYIHPRRKR